MEYAHKLMPEVEQIEKFRTLYRQIPKTHVRECGKEHYLVVNHERRRKRKKIAAVYVHDDHAEAFHSLIAQVQVYRKQEVERKRLAEIEKARRAHDQFVDTVKARYRHFYGLGVIDDQLIYEHLDQHRNHERTDQAILRAVVKQTGLDSVIKFVPVRWQTVDHACKIVFTVKVGKKKIECCSKPTEALEKHLMDLACAGDVKGARQAIKAQAVKVQLKVDLVSANFKKLLPRWVARDAVDAWIAEQVRADKAIVNTKDAVLVLGNILRSLEYAPGIPWIERGRLLCPVAIEHQGVRLTLLSKAPEGEVLKKAVELRTKTVESALAAACHDYRERCRAELQDLIGRGVASKFYRSCKELLGATRANDILVEALEYQMKRFSSHDDLNKKLIYASLLRSMDWCAARELAAAKAERCRNRLPQKIADFYPLARQMSRKITLITGPTNSGKTYDALQKLITAGSGTYLGPLRLLALEVRDTLTEAGHKTSLVTGEYIETLDGAPFTSATIEMADFSSPVELAIIDEAQMLDDYQRGGVWLQAILGIPAKELVILGSPECSDTVKALALELGEELAHHTKERLATLEVNEQATGLHAVPAESAIVAFSRKEILAISAELKQKGRRPAVVYGALSPLVRREQARLFREGHCDVVVASDAIGMGLNLPIRHLFFAAHKKFDGRSFAPASSSLIWQIAGRAGRYGLHESGSVGAINRETLRYVKKTMSSRPAALQPDYQYDLTLPIATIIAEHLATTSLHKILTFFSQELKLVQDSRFTASSDPELLEVAAVLDTFKPLTLQDKMRLLHVPLGRDLRQKFLSDFALMVALKRPGHPCRELVAPLNDMISLATLEERVKALTTWCWLHYRYPTLYLGLEEATAAIDAADGAISKLIGNGETRFCSSCGDPLPWDHSFAMCDDCHHARWRWREDYDEDDFEYEAPKRRRNR